MSQCDCPVCRVPDEKLLKNRPYTTSDGHRCGLWEMVRREPEWAGNRIMATEAERDTYKARAEFAERELSAAFGLPTVTGSPNTRLENLGDGMTCLTYSEGEAEPKLIDFSAVPPGLIEFVKMLRDLMATYSGINNVARGQPEGGITAGNALALLEARAIQFVALSQKADIETMRKVFTTSLHHIQEHAVGEILVRMQGEGNRTRCETFQAQDKPFAAVDGYRIEIGNALQTTNAGRLQLATSAAGSSARSAWSRSRCTRANSARRKGVLRPSERASSPRGNWSRSRMSTPPRRMPARPARALRRS